MKGTDILFINPCAKLQVFQELSYDFVAIEPPIWISFLAGYMRYKGFSVEVIDLNVEQLSEKELIFRITEINPVLAAVIVYGSQPSASTQNMVAAGSLCKLIKENTNAKVAIGGLHPSALPRKTMEEEEVDFVIEGEGFITLELLTSCLKAGANNYSNIPGLWYRDGKSICSNHRAPNVQELDYYTAHNCWDLLPMDRYRAHLWHCFTHVDKVKPYGVIYTSLGCPFSCSFCCINAPFGKPGIRYRSPAIVLQEIELLAHKYNIFNLKIADELFVYDRMHYIPILQGLIERNLNLNIWAYSRIDTIDIRTLQIMKKAGINWLALGIESANPGVRNASKKKLQFNDIKRIINSIREEGIYVIANYVFGLPYDNMQTMNETLEFAMDLNTEFANFYCAMAYPGSKLYNKAISNGWQPPENWLAFSQHSYETVPMGTQFLSPKEVLAFRDQAFQKYFSSENYLSMIELKFGNKVRKVIERLLTIKLRRKLLE